MSPTSSAPRRPTAIERSMPDRYRRPCYCKLNGGYSSVTSRKA